MLDNLSGFMQKLSRSIMMPVAILPVAGVLLGLGFYELPFVPGNVSEIIEAAGGVIFRNLALFFAVGIGLGFTGNSGVAALFALVSYCVMVATMSAMGVYAFGLNPDPQTMQMQTVLGLPSIDTGVFGGILSGGMAAFIFTSFRGKKFHPVIAAIGGPVPFLTGVSAVVLGVAFSYAWPHVQSWIGLFSDWAAYREPVAAGSLYGMVNRLLIPFGLHHVWNMPFFFEIGTYVDPASGQVLHGDIPRFFARDPSAGILSGGFLIMMWGLPAAAAAIWRTARPENRARVGGLMLSAALTSALTGITEPVEFSFMFAAPLLYVIHAALMSSAFALMNIMGAHIGFTFSHGGIDLVLYYVIDTKPWLVFVFGPLYAIVYYYVFKCSIEFFDLKTPGREVTAAAGEAGGPVPFAGASPGPGEATGPTLTTRPGPATGLGPGTVASTSGGAGAGAAAGPGPGTEPFPGTGPGEASGPGPGTGTAAGPGPDTGAAAGPGPGAGTDQGPVAGLPAAVPEGQDLMRELILAFGGSGNITGLDNCITRFRVTVDDQARVDSRRIRELGALSVTQSGRDVQAVYGIRAEHIMTGMQELLQDAEEDAEEDAGDGGDGLPEGAGSGQAVRALREPSGAGKGPGAVPGGPQGQDDLPPVPEGELARLREALGGLGNIASARPSVSVLIVVVRERGRVSPGICETLPLDLYVPSEGNEIHVVTGPGPERYASVAQDGPVPW
jgi:PTS system glucose-specific IIC component